MKPTILIIEDSPVNLTLITELLSGEYKVKIATQGEHALRIAHTHPQPDLVLLDIMMPGMDGYEVCRLLKQDPQTRDIPVIFLTAKIEPKDEEKGLQLGAADYITKPIQRAVFMARIRTQLQLRQYTLHLGQLVQERTAALQIANQKLEKMVATGIELGYERDHNALLQKMLQAAQDLLPCSAAVFWRKTAEDTLHCDWATTGETPPAGSDIALYDAKTRQPQLRSELVRCALQGQSVCLQGANTVRNLDPCDLRDIQAHCGGVVQSLLIVPLASRGGKIFGVMQCVNVLDLETGYALPFSAEQLRLVEALATQAAMLLDNFQLGESQRQLMDAFIELLASTIDAKSQHTGGHCARVPELAVALAQAACKADTGPLADFRFHNEDEWREFRIGAWLHDCGKITTPEFVVDKATKLHTLYNRIHEIRTRFEVLRRDADIARLQALLDGTPAAQANAQFEATCAQLQAEFALLAQANLGSEAMTAEAQDRVRQIGQRTWLRYFDDSLGLAHEERARYLEAPASLPVVEHLLADKAQHIVPRSGEAAWDPKFQFKMQVPEHLYNFGELYNLCVAQGTLTPEERFKINDHIIQTIIMLNRLPLPENLRRVPEYAGTHHETLIGTGYPCKLDASQLSIPARIMAIADIFEALTASDRPYKNGKTLSEAIRILASFKDRQHIDPDLFALFLSSGVYLQFAQRYLQPDQMDAVDISQYLPSA